MRFSGRFKSPPAPASERDWVREVSAASQRREPGRRVLPNPMVRTQLSAHATSPSGPGRVPVPLPRPATCTPASSPRVPSPQGLSLPKNPGSGARPLPLPSLGSDGPARLAIGAELRSYSDPQPQRRRLDTTDMESSVIDEDTEWQIKMAVARAVAATNAEPAPVFPGMGGESIDAAALIIEELCQSDMSELCIDDEDDTLVCDVPYFE